MTSGLKCAAIAFLFVGLTGCRIFGKAKPAPVQVAAPPHPAEEVKPPPPKVEPPGPPPKIDTKPPTEVPQAVAAIPTPPAPKPKKQKPKKPPASVAVQNPKDPPAAGATGENGSAPPAPVPKLGEILSDDQKLQNLRVCDESLTRARENVSQLRGISLSQDQKDSLARIKTFIFQAEQARPKDPQTARQLAERADLLSRDLVKNLR
jgi:hypothetical protein